MSHKKQNYNRTTFLYILKMLKECDYFTFSRFGDADYLMMFPENIGKTIGNSNQFVVTHSLSNEMKEAHSIKDSKYCIGSILKTNTKENVLFTYRGFLKRNMHKVFLLDISLSKLFSAVALTETFMTNIVLFSKLIRRLRKTTTMFVGSYYHENLDFMYGEITHNIITKPTNCYEDVDSILNEILQHKDKCDKIIFSCGQTARVLIKRLWKLGINKTMLDVGSLSDYFILDTKLYNKIKLRKHIVKHEELIKINYNKLLHIMKEDLSMFGGWAIDVECYLKILEILPKGKTILELGSGHTTDKLAERYKMHSIEHNEKWVDRYNSKYIHAPIEEETSEQPPINWYSVSAIKKSLPKHYDLILIDGPVGKLTKNGMTRDGFRRNKHLFNLEDTIIVFDDVQRAGEMNSMLALSKELGRKYEIFESGFDKPKQKKFAIIYP
jgi:hypothetical protein